jgi:DNA-binding winged helix-turn-helix (wHTH) protein
MRVRFGDCVLDSEARELFVRGDAVHLEPKAFGFLEVLLRNRPRALSKNEIHDRLWPGTFVSDGTLTGVLADVRRAIGDVAQEPRFIRTVHRFGYAFCGDAQEIAEGAEAPATGKSGCFLLRGERRWPLGVGEAIIGRDPGAAVRLDDPSVSRQHARMLVAAQSAVLEDLGSKNGTYVGEVKVDRPTPLSDGDQIRIGFVHLTVRIVSAPDSTETGVAER